MSGLIELPEIGPGKNLGPTKVTTKTVDTTDDRRFKSADWNAAMEFLVAFGQAIGLGDGSTEGSLEARVLQILNTLTRINGVYEARIETVTDEGTGTAGARHVTENSSSLAQMAAALQNGNPVALAEAESGVLRAQLQALVNVSGGISGLTLSAINGTLAERARILMETASTITFEALGSTVPLSESGHEALPSGITSIVQGLRLLSGLVNGKGLDAGTWNPTITPVNNVSSATQLGDGVWIEVGGVFFCTCTLDMDVTSTSMAEVKLTPPTDVNFSDYRQALGLAAGAQSISGHCLADTSDDEIRVFTSSSASSRRVTVFARYTE